MGRSCSVDPLERFRFRVTWDNGPGSGTGAEATPIVRAAFHDMQMPKRTTSKGTYRDGVDADVPQLFAGLSTMEDVVLSRGVIADDPNGEFYKWATAVHVPTAGAAPRDGLSDRAAGAASNSIRKTVTIEMYDRAGTVVKAWMLVQAWPVSFIPGSDLDASEDGDKSLEQLTLTYEDFKEMTIANGVTSATVAADVSSTYEE